MEGRRIEGVFLDTAVLRNKAYEAYETARVYELRLLSRVPEALLASLGNPGSRFQATVKAFEQGRVLLLLENGYEVEAENKLSMPIKVGDELTLVLESKEPITLRVVRSFSGMRGVQELIKSLSGLGVQLLKGQDVKGAVENSGLIYERKVWDFLRGALNEDNLVSDLKYQVLSFLRAADTGSVERLLKDVSLPGIPKEEVARLLDLAKRGERLEFFHGLSTIEKELRERILSNEQRLHFIRDTVKQLIHSMVRSLTETAKNLGLRLTLNEKTFRSMESNPKAIGILNEALKSLENNKFVEFVQKLSLLGLKVENPDELPFHKAKVVSTLRDLVRGANTFLGSKLNTEDVEFIARQVRELVDETERLRVFTERLTAELPNNLKENLMKLEYISQMQAFLVAQGGQKFVVPFVTEEGKGVLAFSLGDVFRIFVKLNFEEGFLGILMEAPRRRVDSVSVVFKTDIESLRRSIESSLPELEKGLTDIGLKTKRIEILKEGEEEFDRELGGELGERSVFDLRV
ncbi:hypothetical protein BCF55_0919 [Hydrogenivirga caldilitoris]|uniref:Flagellar hook-length control protein FliK n=1 Tax=Hydrogenivirga caldilitoris TaxID=246264 RepID=A0A497XQT4_9AQUI|nr:hypothetical protein [Hydrogenivirga caldilitoris]RLJ70641.1 hypothetical protein BCF55_0919 [Hydrogenivirga caldilitoris]